LKKFLILIALASLLVFLATAKAGVIGEDPISTTPSSRPWCLYAEDLLAAAQFPAVPVLGQNRHAD